MLLLLRLLLLLMLRLLLLLLLQLLLLLLLLLLVLLLLLLLVVLLLLIPTLPLQQQLLLLLVLLRLQHAIDACSTCRSLPADAACPCTGFGRCRVLDRAPGRSWRRCLAACTGHWAAREGAVRPLKPHVLLCMAGAAELALSDYFAALLLFNSCVHAWQTWQESIQARFCRLQCSAI